MLMRQNGMKEGIINYLGWGENRVGKAFLWLMYFEG